MNQLAMFKKLNEISLTGVKDVEFYVKSKSQEVEQIDINDEFVQAVSSRKFKACLTDVCLAGDTLFIILEEAN